MNKVILVFVSVLFASLNLLAQTPNEMSYQAVVRDANGELATSQQVGVRIQILEGSEFGAANYVETHTVTTNSNGLLTLVIGSGNIVLGDFSAIDWSAGMYFVKNEIDLSGGENYSITGVSQLLSVPYALHAKMSESAVEVDPEFSGWDRSAGISITEGQISDLKTYLQNEIDGDSLNELQVLSINADTIFLSSGGYVKLPAGFSGSFNDLADIPSNLDTNSTDDFDGAYSSLSGLPVNLSEFVNDVPFLITDTTLTEAEVDEMVGDNGYLMEEVDADTLNEIQTLLNVLQEGNDAGGVQISNVAEPTAANDVVTKVFLDSLLVRIGATDKLVALGYAIEDLLGGGHDVSALLDADVSVSDLYDNGVMVGSLEQAGADSAALANAGLIGTISDTDGNVYKWVKIGEQIWMAENLMTTQYNDGSNIPLVTSNSAWISLITPAYCWYGNDQAAHGNTYGGMYNWYTVETGKLCPAGWHLPSGDEWKTLTDYLGGTSVAGGKLKELGTAHWSSPNTDATNETGFTALPGGNRYDQDGGFYNLSSNSYWWSATESNGSYSYGRGMRNNGAYVTDSFANWKSGNSVRCVKD